MTLDEILAGLFPQGHAVKRDGDVLTGHGPLPSGGEIAVVGIVAGAPLTPTDVVPMAAHVLDTVEAGRGMPILVLVDTAGQVMSRQAEMLGLNEFCAHLAKCLILASLRGHRTIGFQYGKAAAGGFLATALATDMLVSIEGATPEVMDLPSMARVTKLPLDKLKEMAKSNPVFAPGLDPIYKTGAIAAIWDASRPLDAQLAEALRDADARDRRGEWGKRRGGRPVSASIVERVIAAVTEADA